MMMEKRKLLKILKFVKTKKFSSFLRQGNKSANSTLYMGNIWWI